MTTLVSLRGVSRTYRLGRTDVHALRGIDLDVSRGGFVSVAGPSGSGKTTLLNLVGCIDTPTHGCVSISGQDTRALSDQGLTELRLRKLGFVFQSFNLVPVLSVSQNVELPLLLQGGTTLRERRSRVDRLLEAVGIAGQAAHRPGELSGGQRQRVAIARALVGRPELVVADEPTANLDSRTGQQVIDLMRQLNRSEGTTFIFSTHDPQVMGHATTVIRLADGAVVGTGRELLATGGR